VAITVAQERGHVVVRVSDDGRGLDRQRLVERALRLGVIDRPPTTPEAVDRLVFLSGLSTADHLSQVSGRGVGMDVVLRQVESLRGSVTVDNRPGEGTSFVLRLPLSLAVIDGFHVEVGGDTYVLPIESVVATTELAETLAAQPTGLLRWREKTLPFLRLRDAFGFPTVAPERQIAIIVGTGEAQHAALVVDRVLGQELTVVKAIARAFDNVPGLAGATVLNDGRVALVLQPEALVGSLLARSRGDGPAMPTFQP
jgi:two-component system chemotaxis sensor kinase CheA